MVNDSVDSKFNVVGKYLGLRYSPLSGTSLSTLQWLNLVKSGQLGDPNSWGGDRRQCTLLVLIDFCPI